MKTPQAQLTAAQVFAEEDRADRMAEHDDKLEAAAVYMASLHRTKEMQDARS